jgi:hypothetical protein
MELKMQRFVFSVVSSLGEMRRIEKVREKIKNRMIEPKEVRRIAVVSL